MYGINISNEELLEDIRLTRIELGAYYSIYNGFKILSNLPENKGIEEVKYNNESQKYLNLCEECNEFLCELENLKIDREL
jgi:hypothetical protein